MLLSTTEMLAVQLTVEQMKYRHSTYCHTMLIKKNQMYYLYTVSSGSFISFIDKRHLGYSQTRSILSDNIYVP